MWVSVPKESLIGTLYSVVNHNFHVCKGVFILQYVGMVSVFQLPTERTEGVVLAKVHCTNV